MYVQWLLEFVWRIFIQGPLLFINFFTGRKDSIKNLSNLFRFKFGSSELNRFFNSFISISFILAIGATLFLMIFIFKIIKILVTSKTNENKTLIIDSMKEFGKSIVIILVFGVCFSLFFSLFDELANALDSAFYGIEGSIKPKINSINSLFSGTINDIINKPSDIIGNITGTSNHVIQDIPGQIYQLITGEPLGNKNKNFLFPSENFLSKMDTINWLVSIFFVISFSWFLLWIVWSTFQKIIEIFFLYLTFPISVAFSLESNKIHWKIWIKEIINKAAIIFGLMLFLRLFLYAFYFIETVIINKIRGFSKVNHYKLILSLFITLGFGSAMMFIIKLFSRNSKEYVGIFGVANSFKQTRNFISNNNINDNNSYQTNINNDELNKINTEQINNSNVELLKKEIGNSIGTFNNDYLILEKAKIFKQ